MLRHTFGIEDPAALSDEEWFDLYAQYKYLRKEKTQIIEYAIIEAFNKIVTAINNG